MLQVKKISLEEMLVLENIKKNHSSHIPRMRAHAVLLSLNGYEIHQISDIFGVCRKTTTGWIGSWNKQGVLGLFDKPRSGRPRKVKANDSCI